LPDKDESPGGLFVAFFILHLFGQACLIVFATNLSPILSLSLLTEQMRRDSALQQMDPDEPPSGAVRVPALIVGKPRDSRFLTLSSFDGNSILKFSFPWRQRAKKYGFFFWFSFTFFPLLLFCHEFLLPGAVEVCWPIPISFGA